MATFNLSGYSPVANDILINSVRGWQIFALMSLKISDGILFGPDALPFSSELIIEIISSGSTGSKIKFCSTGLYK